MKHLSPTQIAQKWATNLGAATTSIRDGVNGVSVAPGQTAASRKQAYIDGVNRSVDKWAARVASVSLQSWQSAMINKGIPIIATRATAAIPKFTLFMQAWMSFQQNIATELASQYPRGTLDQNINRAVYVMRRAKEFKLQNAL